jgi:hypothetical protein
MTFPANIDCKIAQDLLVGYVTGEVSPETRTWITQHLDRCADCRQALAQYTAATGALHQVPLMTPPADPGRRTLGRMRRAVWVIVTVVVLCIAITAGSVIYAVTNFRRWTNMPVDQPVPPTAYSTELAAKAVDLSALGLTWHSVTVEPETARLSYTDAAGHPIRVELTRADDTAGARRAFRNWSGSFHSKLTSAETNVGENWTAKFRSQGQYCYGWQHNNWLITISVPEKAPNPAELRDQIRDLLFTEIRALQ